MSWKQVAKIFRHRWLSAEGIAERNIDRYFHVSEEIREARNEAATVRRAYLHEKARADEAVRLLHDYDPEEAERLMEQKYDRARLDEDRTAKPKTEIVGHYPEGRRNFYANAERLTYRATTDQCARCWARGSKPCEVCNYPLPRRTE